MKLYDFGVSGNCYKIRLFLSLIGLPHDVVAVNLGLKENLASWFLAINPEGCVPVIVDDNITVSDSAAILTYLARMYASSGWFPQEAVAASKVVRWLSMEQGMMRYGLARGRSLALHNPTRLTETGDLEECRRIGAGALNLLEDQLSHTHWLVGDAHPTIADIACYPYSKLAPDAGLSLDSYPALQNWFGQIEALPGYRVM